MYSSFSFLSEQFAQYEIEHDLLNEHEQVVGRDRYHPDLRDLETDVEGDEPVDPPEHVVQRSHLIGKECLEGAVREQVIYLFKECTKDI